MFRIFIWLTIIVALVLLVYFIHDDGLVTVEFLGYYIESSFLFAAFSLVTVAVISAYIFYIIILLKNLPEKISASYEEKKIKTMLTNLVEGFSSLTIGDLHKVRKTSKEVSKLEKKEYAKFIEPVILIFKAEVANNLGNDDELEKIALTMMSNTDLEQIALKYLVFLYNKQQKYSDALMYAERAYNINHKASWIVLALIELYIKHKLWNRAENMIKNALEYSFKSTEELESQLIFVLINIAKDAKSEKNYDLYLKTLKKIEKIDIANLEALNMRIKYLIEVGEEQELSKIIFEAWKKDQKRELIDILLKATENKTIDERLEYLGKLKKIHPESEEVYIEIINLLLEKNMLEEASGFANELLSKCPVTPRVAKIMVLLGIKNHYDYDELLKWSNRL